MIVECLAALTPTSVVELNPGDTLFRQGEATRGLFLVRRGRLKLQRESIDGHEIILQIAQRYQFLAEASLFSSHYHCHARADNRSSVVFYERNLLLDFLRENADAALGLIEVLAIQTQKLRLLIEIRGIRSARKRLLQYLHLNLDANQQPQIESTYKDLAITLGMTHETLYRIFARLEQENIIERQGKIISPGKNYAPAQA